MRRTLFCLFLSLAVCLLCASGALADDYFNAGISVEEAAGGALVVTIEDSPVLREEKPRLRLGFDGQSASVLHGGRVSPAALSEGGAEFEVAEGGAYILAPGEYISELTAEPGCTSEGKYTYTSADGSLRYTEAIPALGHDFSDTRLPTCANCDEPNPNYRPYVPPAASQPEGGEEDGPEPGDPAEFTDVPEGAYYAEAVRWAAEGGVTGGTAPGVFSPDLACTRAQVVAFLYRAAGCPEVSAGSQNFTDVTPGAYYEDAVRWALELGVASGVAEGVFGPDEPVSRAQVVTFLHRLAGSPSPSGSGGFADVPPGAYYADAALWAAGEGIAQGYGDGCFHPEAVCTRAQVVTLLYRYFSA